MKDNPGYYIRVIILWRRLSMPMFSAKNAAADSPVSQANAHQSPARNASAAFPAPVQMLTASYYTSNAKTNVGNASINESNGARATVAPGDYDSGSGTNDTVRAVSREATTAFGQRFIAGHMLNNHLGGPGNDQQNITAITSGQNSAHHAALERHAKNEVKGNKDTIEYYTFITHRADFYRNGALVGENMASQLEGGYKRASDGSVFGPVTITLGPQNGTKQNEGTTGMNASGATAAAVSATEETASINADAMLEVLYDADHEKMMKTYYGKDEDDVRAVIIDIILKKYPDIAKLSRHVKKWLERVEDHDLNGDPLPRFLR